MNGLNRIFEEVLAEAKSKVVEAEFTEKYAPFREIFPELLGCTYEEFHSWFKSLEKSKSSITEKEIYKLWWIR